MPILFGRLASTDYYLVVVNPKLAEEWHPTKNSPLTPNDITPNYKYKVWWKCNKDHEWEATVDKRNGSVSVKGTNCPYCSGIYATKDNIAVLNPNLREEWNTITNLPMTPYDVTPNSHKKVWWICLKNKEHIWEAEIASRNNGAGCPFCAGKRKINT